MKHLSVRFVNTCLLIGTLLLPCAALAISLEAYTKQCEKELDIPENSITKFDCLDGEILPTSQFGENCDSQAFLGDVLCVDNSRLGMMSFSTNPDVKGVWICRKYATFKDDPNDKFYHDIAMIIHNRKNGKTCFFQNDLNPTSDSNMVPEPGGESSPTPPWRTPPDTAAAHCTSCHKNDPFIISPHVAQAFNLFNLTRFNPKGLYSVVGSENGGDFTSFTANIAPASKEDARGLFAKSSGGCAGICHFDPANVGGMVDKAIQKHWMPLGNPMAPQWITPKTSETPGHTDPPGFSPYNFNPSVGQFYSLRSNGQIWGFNGSGGGGCFGTFCPHWTLLDSNPNTAEIAASGTKLYQRHTTGLIWEFTGVQCLDVGSCPGWRMLDNNSSSAQIVSGGGHLYQLRQDHSIWRWTGARCSGNSCPGWQMVDKNSTVDIVASGNSLYQRRGDGSTWIYTGTACSGNSCPGWQKIGNDPKTTDLVDGSTAVYRLNQSGEVWKYTGTPCNSSGCPGWQLLLSANTNVKQIAAGSTSLYRLDTNGTVWRYQGPGQNWVQLDSFARNVEISASFSGLLLRHSAGDVWRFKGPVCSNGGCPGWMQIQSFTDTISILGARQ